MCATLFFLSSLALAYLSTQSSSAPASLLEDAPVVETRDAEVPELSEDTPVTDMPQLEAVDDEPLDLPEIEDDAASDDSDNRE